MSVVISAEHISKKYTLGTIGTGMLSKDIQEWWLRRWKRERIEEAFTSPKNNEHWALRQIDFSVSSGDAIGIIGRNGAGKSTLLKILSRITSPTIGSVKVKGRIASILEVGTGFHPELTGRENIFLNGAILGMRRTQIVARLNEIIEFSGVEKFIDTPVKRYSSGMYVRLAFAVAAHLDADILIVDEVLAVGDMEFQKKCIGKMQDVSSQKGRTVLFVSHNMAAVSKLCSKGIFLSEGTVKFSGEISATIREYLNYNPDPSGRIAEQIPENSRLRSAELLRGRDQKHTSTILSGEDIIIRLSFFSTEQIPRAVVRIAVKNNLGEVLFVCNNNHTDQPYRLQNAQTIDCHIPHLPLFTGIYTCDYTLTNDLETVEEIENVLTIHVENGDFYKTGKIPQMKAKFMVQHHWEKR
jgi:lipopolysaccharide transport system ATP-binding protein